MSGQQMFTTIDLHLEIRNLMQAGRGHGPMVREGLTVTGEMANGSVWTQTFESVEAMMAWAVG